MHPKIMSLDAILASLATSKAGKRIVMCHGTFDLVHPGHIRHLLFAKEHGDILVVSLTCDAHVSKGPGRPFVPEMLRAQNLAVMEMVDLVFIDPEPTPMKTIAELQPDIYAKGYDYADSVIEETALVESYGGTVLFSPGDIAFSSTAIIKAGAPDLSIDKLLLLLRQHDLTFAGIATTVRGLVGVPAYVVGDTIIDTYVYGTLLGHNAKTPTPSIRYDSEVSHVGGAAIVALHLAAAGADVRFSTVLGADVFGDMVCNEMQSASIELQAPRTRGRPTTEKRSFIADGYRLLKVDTLDNMPIGEVLITFLEQSISAVTEGAVVFCDFRHGIFHPGSIERLASAIPDDCFAVADSQLASRWGNILDFRDFDLITPNEREARFALGDQDTVVRPLGQRLRKRARADTVMLKMGGRGLMTFTGPGASDFISVDSFVREVVDPVGAGDALLAYATLVMTKFKNPVLASIVGSLAAAVECETEGNVPVTPDKIIALLDYLEARK